MRELWEEFQREVPDPVGAQPVWSDVVGAAREAIDGGLAWLARAGSEPAAFAWATAPVRGVARLEYLYVRSVHRRQGLARRLVRAVAEATAARGATELVLEVVATNEAALATWEALGFRLIEHRLAAPVTSSTSGRDSR